MILCKRRSPAYKCVVVHSGKYESPKDEQNEWVDEQLVRLFSLRMVKDRECAT